MSAENKKLPSFKRSAGGMLSRTEGAMSQKALDNAEHGELSPDGGGVIPAQHCSHGSHGSW